MLDFPIKTLNTIKSVLLRQEKEIEKNIEEFEEADPAKAPALAESSEPGTDSYIADTHTKTVVLEGQLKKQKTSIIKALSKMKDGSYGKCENCKNSIGISRLLAMPTAVYCLSCTQKLAKKT